MLRNQIVNCDCVEGMTQLRAESIPVTVTSPPYDQIRRYGGSCWDFDVFKGVADQLWRVTKPGGVVCWVVQDQVKNRQISGTKLQGAVFHGQGLHAQS